MISIGISPFRWWALCVQLFLNSLLAALCVASLPIAGAQPVSADAVASTLREHVVSIVVVGERFHQGTATLSLSGGSGTVVSDAGHVLTNAHVTHGGRSFRIVFADGREVAADRTGEDVVSDLAVLQLRGDRRDWPFARIGDESGLSAGDPVYAIGAPWGLSNSFSAGVVNNPARLLASMFQDESEYDRSYLEGTASGRYYAWIQHDAPISPGNSGGPLVDAKGQFVGVNTLGSFFGGDMAFAIPGSEARRVLAELTARRPVPRADFGLSLRSLKGTRAAQGALVTAVTTLGPADRAGILPGDRLMSVNDTVVQASRPLDVPAIQRRIAELKPGESVKFTFERGAAPHTVELVADSEQPPTRERELIAWGITARDLDRRTARQRGIEGVGWILTGARPGGAAAAADPPLLADDIIRAIDDKAPPALAEAISHGSVLSSAKPKRVEFDRRGALMISVLIPRAGDRTREPQPLLRKPWVGADVQPITAEQAQVMGLSSAGFRIARVYPNAPFTRAGFRVGDLVTALDGAPLPVSSETDTSPFLARVRAALLDSPLKVRVLRAGQVLERNVRVEVAPPDRGALPVLEVERLRIALRPLTVTDRAEQLLPAGIDGLLVERVEGGGPGGLARLAGSDIILALDGRRVTDFSSFQNAYAAVAAASEDAIRIEIHRRGERRLLLLDRSWLEKTQ